MTPERSRRKEDHDLIKTNHLFVSFIGLFVAATAYVFTTFPTKEFVRDGDSRNAQATENYFRELKEQNARIETEIRETKTMMLTIMRERKH